MVRLITKDEYEVMTPYAKGYIVGAQGDHEKSPLRGQTNPFDKRLAAEDHAAWERGREQGLKAPRLKEQGDL